VLAEFFFKIQLRLEIALSCFANFKQCTIHGANIQKFGENERLPPEKSERNKKMCFPLHHLQCNNAWTLNCTAF